MSRYNEDQESANQVYELANEWKETCLIGEGSMFFEGAKLWTKENLTGDSIDQLIEAFTKKEPLLWKTLIRFRNEAITREHRERFANAFEGLQPSLNKLAAEIIWVFTLAISDLRNTVKIDNVLEIWKLLEEPTPSPEEMREQYGPEGLGNVTTHRFRKYFHQEITTFILFLREWFTMEASDRKNLLTNESQMELSKTWDLWIDTWTEDEYDGITEYKDRVVRHFVMHLLFPDKFERIFSSNLKREIIQSAKVLAADRKPLQKLSCLKKEDATLFETHTQIDICLLDIRQANEKEHSDKKLDYFSKNKDDPLRELRELRKKPRNPKQTGVTDMESHPHLNQILYGPPGTGKTYRTIDLAVQIIDRTWPNDDRNRKKLQKRFTELQKEGRIAVVTFHQSYGYEEFVEGLAPKLEVEEDSGAIAYEIRSGVFKNLCEDARNNAYIHDSNIADVPKVGITEAWKLFKSNLTNKGIKLLTPPRKSPFMVFPGQGFIYRIGEEGGGAERTISINAIEQHYKNPKATTGDPGYMDAILIHLVAKYGLEMTKNIKNLIVKHNLKILEDTENLKTPTASDNSKRYVLIIDEINRGNISRIFGELITLIEPSKRLGKKEEIRVTLPTSQESFGVPNNLYIIGTMNTADRSIALLDTALRRRFRFEEMMPLPKKLKDISIGEGDKEIKIEPLLEAMNKRIEALHDRDHQIGHTYFIPLKDDGTFKDLEEIFLHEILPLLQEYFYEDWEKVNLVLNSNGFIRQKQLPPMQANDFVDREKKLWKIDEMAFNKPENYRKIYEKAANSPEADADLNE